MRDEFHLDTTPYEESCEQIGPNFNYNQAKKEAQVFIAQLIGEFGEPQSGTSNVDKL